MQIRCSGRRRTGAVRAYIETLLPDILEGRIQPGRVFDRTIKLAEVPDGYRAMDNRQSLKVHGHTVANRDQDLGIEEGFEGSCFGGARGGGRDGASQRSPTAAGTVTVCSFGPSHRASVGRKKRIVILGSGKRAAEMVAVASPRPRRVS